jgi:DNA-binding MarR family transcriptional regulator
MPHNKMNPPREQAITYKIIAPASSNSYQGLILVDKIFDSRNLSKHGKLGGLYLACCAHNQEIGPSLSAIAKRCKIGKSAAIEDIRKLKSQGFLEEVRHRPGRKVIKDV